MPKYVSLERFFVLRELGQLSGKEFIKLDRTVKATNRDPIRISIRSLINDLSKIGINISIFKRDRRYRVTEEVADFFLYFLDYFQYKYDSQIRQKQFEDIPQIDLIGLRMYFIEALYSAEYNQRFVEDTVKEFERVTGCPATSSTLQTSNFTVDAINFLKEMQEAVTPKVRGEAPPVFDLVELMYNESLKVPDSESSPYSIRVKSVSPSDTKSVSAQMPKSPFDTQEPMSSLHIGTPLNEQDWNELTSLIEYTYRYNWYPRLVNACISLFNDYCDQRGIIYSDTPTTASKLPWDKTASADGHMGGDK